MPSPFHTKVIEIADLIISATNEDFLSEVAAHKEPNLDESKNYISDTLRSMDLAIIAYIEIARDDEKLKRNQRKITELIEESGGNQQVINTAAANNVFQPLTSGDTSELNIITSEIGNIFREPTKFGIRASVDENDLAFFLADHIYTHIEHRILIAKDLRERIVDDYLKQSVGCSLYFQLLKYREVATLEPTSDQLIEYLASQLLGNRSNINCKKVYNVEVLEIPLPLLTIQKPHTADDLLTCFPDQIKFLLRTRTYPLMFGLCKQIKVQNALRIFQYICQEPEIQTWIVTERPNQRFNPQEHFVGKLHLPDTNTLKIPFMPDLLKFVETQQGQQIFKYLTMSIISAICRSLDSESVDHPILKSLIIQNTVAFLNKQIPDFLETFPFQDFLQIIKFSHFQDEIHRGLDKGFLAFCTPSRIKLLQKRFPVLFEKKVTKQAQSNKSGVSTGNNQAVKKDPVPAPSVEKTATPNLIRNATINKKIKTIFSKLGLEGTVLGITSAPQGIAESDPIEIEITGDVAKLTKLESHLKTHFRCSKLALNETSLTFTLDRNGVDKWLNTDLAGLFVNADNQQSNTSATTPVNNQTTNTTNKSIITLTQPECSLWIAAIKASVGGDISLSVTWHEQEGYFEVDYSTLAEEIMVSKSSQDPSYPVIVDATLRDQLIPVLINNVMKREAIKPNEAMIERVEGSPRQLKITPRDKKVIYPESLHKFIYDRLVSQGKLQPNKRQTMRDDSSLSSPQGSKGTLSSAKKGNEKSSDHSDTAKAVGNFRKKGLSFKYMTGQNQNASDLGVAPPTANEAKPENLSRLDPAALQADQMHTKVADLFKQIAQSRFKHLNFKNIIKLDVSNDKTITFKFKTNAAKHLSDCDSNRYAVKQVIDEIIAAIKDAFKEDDALKDKKIIDVYPGQQLDSYKIVFYKKIKSVDNLIAEADKIQKVYEKNHQTAFKQTETAEEIKARKELLAQLEIAEQEAALLLSNDFKNMKLKPRQRACLESLINEIHIVNANRSRCQDPDELFISKYERNFLYSRLFHVMARLMEANKRFRTGSILRVMRDVIRHADNELEPKHFNVIHNLVLEFGTLQENESPLQQHQLFNQPNQQPSKVLNCSMEVLKETFADFRTSLTDFIIDKQERHLGEATVSDRLSQHAKIEASIEAIKASDRDDATKERLIVILRGYMGLDTYGINCDIYGELGAHKDVFEMPDVMFSRIFKKHLPDVLPVVENNQISCSQ